MPINQYTYTFNRDGSKGFYSRTLFTWVVGVDGYDLMQQSTWYDEADGDGLELLANNKPELCHPTGRRPVFPRNYWTSGKTIRFRGTFLADTGVASGRSFNLRFGIKDREQDLVEWLAIQNNDNNHTFYDGQSTSSEYIPVNFHCLLMCGIPNDSNSAWFTTNGFYKYNLDSNSSTGNEAVVQVPVWLDSGQGSNGVSKGISTGYTEYETVLMMNCYNSTLDRLQLVYLTIEELA